MGSSIAASDRRATRDDNFESYRWFNPRLVRPVCIPEQKGHFLTHHSDDSAPRISRAVSTRASSRRSTALRYGSFAFIGSA